MHWQLPVAASPVPASGFDAIVDNSAGVVRDTTTGLYTSIGDALNTLKNTFGKNHVTIGVRYGTGTYTETTSLTGNLADAFIIGLSGGNIGTGSPNIPTWDINGKLFNITQLNLANLFVTMSASNANAELFTASYVTAYNCVFTRQSPGATRITKTGSDHTLIDCVLGGQGGSVAAIDPGCINLEMLGGAINPNATAWAILGNSTSGTTQWNFHGVHFITTANMNFTGPIAVALVGCTFGDGFGVGSNATNTLTFSGSQRVTLQAGSHKNGSINLAITDVDSLNVDMNIHGALTVTNANLKPYRFNGAIASADITGPGVYDFDLGQISISDTTGSVKLRGVGIAARFHANGIGNTANGLLAKGIGLTRSRIDIATRFTGTNNNQQAFTEDANCGSNIVDIAGDGSFPVASTFNGAPPAGTVASLSRLA